MTEGQGRDALARSVALAEGRHIYTASYRCRFGHDPERYVRGNRCVACTRAHSARVDPEERKKRRPAKWARERATRAAAIEAGAATYQSEKPCAHGHLGKRYTKGGNCVACGATRSKATAAQLTEKRRSTPERKKLEEMKARGMKQCTRCLEKKPFDCFYPAKIGFFKLTPLCKPCNTIFSKEYYWECAELRPEALKKRRGRKYNNSREKNIARSAKWIKDNPEKYRQYLRTTEHRRREALNNSTSHFTTADVKRIFKEQQGRCAYHRHCGQRLGKSYHIDHIVPLSKGGSNAASNIQLTCGPCNVRKSAKLPHVWASEIGLLL